MQKERCLLGCLKGNKKVVNKINVILNLFQDLIRFLKRNKVEMLKRVQHDVLFYHGAKAFTLIELLVVVLIIGILAAVAVPQYKKAVYKSRFAKLELLAKEYVQAAQAYRLATGEWPAEFDVLAINPTGTVAKPTGNDCRKINDMFCCLGPGISNYQNAHISCGLSNKSLFYEQHLSNSYGFCAAQKDDSIANSVCASRGDFVASGNNTSPYNVPTPTGHYVGVNVYKITK